MVPRVLVGAGDDPCGGVGDAEVEDFALLDEVVEALHDLGDGCGPWSRFSAGRPASGGTHNPTSGRLSPVSDVAQGPVYVQNTST